MADLAVRLRHLEDRAAIQDLIAAYGPLADCGSAQTLAQLWIPDGEYVVAGFGAARGHAQIAALIEGETHQQLLAQGCGHVLSPHTISITGDEADARGYSVVFRHSAGTFEPWRVSANIWKFVRTVAGWRVKLRENAPLDGSNTARSLLEMKHDD